MFSFLLLLPLVLAQSPLRIFHRIHNPLLEEPAPFSLRATLHLDASVPRLDPSPDDQLDFQLDNSSFYQVALERTTDQHHGHWAISSVKACHVPHAISDSLLLHISNTGVPFSINYFVAPVPHDGSCPISVSHLNPSPFLNTTVFVRTPSLPPLPELRVPPPLTTEGAPIQPAPEKTFIQKYWIYIVVVLGALMLSGGSEEETPRRAAS